jgi:hypothetical protein
LSLDKRKLNLWSLAAHLRSDYLGFYDRPKSNSLTGEQFLGFTTQLVGVLPDKSPKSLGIIFTWTSNFNQTNGKGGVTLGNSVGLSQNLQTSETVSETGGVIITGSNDTTDYDYTGGFTVDSINNIANGSTFNILVSVPEPSQLLNNIFSLSLFLIFLKRRKQILAYRFRKDNAD